MQKKLRAVVIGLGGQSLGDHLPALTARDDTEVAGVADVNPAAETKFRELFPSLAEVPFYTDSITMLDEVKPDFAIVAVPHHLYYGIVEALCVRDIAFLKEKPLARNLEEAARILALPNVERCAFVATQRRFSGLYAMAWQALGDIGQPYLFQGVYKLSISGPHTGWRGDRELAGGGCLIDMGYHLVDQLTWWFGLPEQLNAHISTMAVPDADYTAEDTASISFRYKSGMHGTLVISRCAGAKHEEYQIYGTKGYMVGSKKGVTIYDRDGNMIREIKPEGEDMITAQLNFFISRITGGRLFDDLHSDHMLNMVFINRCYSIAAHALSQQ